MSPNRKKAAHKPLVVSSNLTLGTCTHEVGTKSLQSAGFLIPASQPIRAAGALLGMPK